LPKFIRKKLEKIYANNIYNEKLDFTALSSQLVFSHFSQNFSNGFLKIGHL